jgi:protein-disulfide isomerase
MGFAVVQRKKPPALVSPNKWSVSNPESLRRALWNIGPSDATFKLVVWTDYACPACKRFEVEVEALRQRLGDSLHVIYRHMPLTEIHPGAFRAAVVAECSRQQERFAWAHRALFSMSLRDSVPHDGVAQVAQIPDRVAFESCLSDRGATAAIESEMLLADSLGIKATPTLLIGDTIHTGGMPSAILEARLRKLR